MSRRCPIYGSTVLYLDCLECEEKLCKKVKEKKRSKESESEKFKNKRK